MKLVTLEFHPPIMKHNSNLT